MRCHDVCCLFCLLLNFRSIETCFRRDRLAFSKSLLRRFLRECLDRDSSLASPWIVKPSLAHKYGIPNDMPDDIKSKLEDKRDAEIKKRKRVWERKEELAKLEGRKTKKMLKMEEKEQKGICLSMTHLLPF